MSWPWPEGAARRHAGALLAAPLALLTACRATAPPGGAAGPGPAAGNPVGQQEAEEAMPEVKLFEPSGGQGGRLLPPLGKPSAPPLGAGGAGGAGN
jgi:hypothetical protein